MMVFPLAVLVWLKANFFGEEGLPPLGVGLGLNAVKYEAQKDE